MKVAVVGATGLVGRKMLQVLEERKFPVGELIPVASQRSVGKQVQFGGKACSVVSMEETLAMQPDVALFSAGSAVSKEWGPLFAKAGTFVIDNSSAWRMDPLVPLIVPEVNGGHLQQNHKLIANPNCSTIQMVVALAPLHRRWSIDRLVISTYQSITGTGKEAVTQYESERNGTPAEMVYPHRIFENCLPHCDVFLDNAYTREEMKLVHETRKILDQPEMRITATAVRVPVMGGHSESVNCAFKADVTVDEIVQCLRRAEGVVVEDEPMNNKYPMPLDAHGHDEVFVGRIRPDESQPNTFNLWIVSDNLRKGAATNAIQIAEMLVARGLLPAQKVHVIA